MKDMVPTEYDVERETEFCRQQLATTIPNRLNELLEKVDHSRGYIEDWYADLILKISLSIGRVCNDLFKTTEQDALPAAAWNARNLLELWVWTKYCSTSRDKARHLHEDAVRDMMGLAALHSKMCEVAGVDDELGAVGQEKLRKIAADQLGLATIDANYTKVAEAAKNLGLQSQYAPTNQFLSKLAHPTAGLVVGIMHQSDDSLRGLQCSCTAMGLYFAGQCVLAMDEIVSAATSQP
jgi:hypothetical protein